MVVTVGPGLVAPGVVPGTGDPGCTWAGEAPVVAGVESGADVTVQPARTRNDRMRGEDGRGDGLRRRPLAHPDALLALIALALRQE